MCSLFQDFEKIAVDLSEEMCFFKMHDILHDFAQFIRKNGSEMEETKCETCNALLASHVKQYRSLFLNHKRPPLLQFCDCLKSVRLPNLRRSRLQSIPVEIEKLIHLRWLGLGENGFPSGDVKAICKLYNLEFLWVDNCDLEEIPREIGNLIRLKHLNLFWNNVTELPDSLCDLHELESLDISFCRRLSVLPQGIDRLQNLKHLRYESGDLLKQFPPG